MALLPRAPMDDLIDGDVLGGLGVSSAYLGVGDVSVQLFYHVETRASIKDRQLCSLCKSLSILTREGAGLREPVRCGVDDHRLLVPRDAIDNTDWY